MPRKIRWSKYWIIRILKILRTERHEKNTSSETYFGLLVADMLEYPSAVRSKLLMMFKFEGSFFYTGKIWIGALKKRTISIRLLQVRK
jgi:hypothetical protein